MKAELLALAERVEGLTGPCRQTDLAIDLAVNGDPDSRFPDAAPYVRNAEFWWSKKAAYASTWEMRDLEFHRPALFTGSLDAARSLVPDGWRVALDIGAHGTTGAWLSGGVNGNWADVRLSAATPGLALTAAALRAKAETVND